MIATHNQPTSTDGSTSHASSEPAIFIDNETGFSNVKNLATPPSLVLQSNSAAHHPKAGVNLVVDAAGYLFSIIGKLKDLTSYRQLGKLQKELIQEVETFQASLQSHGYNAEYIIVTRYILCAALDDIIANTTWGAQGQWDSHNLLAAFNQDMQHQDKFFTIMERAIKEPAVYIDLMELMYICLSMGYKGQYRSTEHNQYQLEQITNSLYKHIRAYRGSFSKTLSPTPLKTAKPTAASVKGKTSYLLIFFVTACVIMAIFIGLGYLMDVISNEPYEHISPVESSTPSSA